MNKKIMYIVTILSTAVLLFLDQIAKYLAVLHLKGQAAIPIIKNVFELQYLENQGAAFGIMQGKKTFFVIGTLIFLVIVVILYHNIPLTKRFTPNHPLSISERNFWTVPGRQQPETYPDVPLHIHP